MHYDCMVCAALGHRDFCRRPLHPNTPVALSHVDFSSSDSCASSVSVWTVHFLISDSSASMPALWSVWSVHSVASD